MRTGGWLLGACVALASLACGLDLSDLGPEPPGAPDARGLDAAAPDATAMDTSGPDARSPDAATPDAEEPIDAAGPCTTRTIVACRASHSEVGDCAQLHDGREVAPRCPTQSTVTLSCRTGTPSYCDTSSTCLATTGCIANVWFQFDLGASMSVSQARFIAGWWADRPDEFEIWYSNSPTDLPGAGATRIYSGSAATHPWHCVSGEPCSDEVPDGCCPDGRDRPQVTDQTSYTPSCNLGTYFPKFNTATFAPAIGRYWYLMVRNGVYDDRVFLNEVQLRVGATCR